MSPAGEQNEPRFRDGGGGTFEKSAPVAGVACSTDHECRGGDPGQQLWVLALMAVVLMAGLAFGERLFVWWGAAGVAVCIMWAMRCRVASICDCSQAGRFRNWLVNSSRKRGGALATDA